MLRPPTLSPSAGSWEAKNACFSCTNASVHSALSMEINTCQVIRHCRLHLQALVFRLLLLSTVSVESSGAVVVIQMLHGPCFACFWIAAVDYANTSAPQGMEGTAQSLVSTCMYIVGPGIGSVVWSYIYQSYGAPVAYICGASVAAANAVALGKLQLAQPATQPLRAMRP